MALFRLYATKRLGKALDAALEALIDEVGAGEAGEFGELAYEAP